MHQFQPLMYMALYNNRLLILYFLFATLCKLLTVCQKADRTFNLVRSLSMCHIQVSLQDHQVTEVEVNHTL